MQQRQEITFSTIESEGALLPPDLLARIDQGDKALGGLSSAEYHCPGEQLNEVISDAWARVRRRWLRFQEALVRYPQMDETQLTHEHWLLPLFHELGYGRLVKAPPQVIGEKSYPIAYFWGQEPVQVPVPIHLVGWRTDLDQTQRLASGGRSSPFSLVQEWLNRSSGHLWGIVSNGLRLRLLRRNVSLTRQAYLEFDLEAMLRGEVYADFVLFWLLCHQSRFECEDKNPAECWLERWSRQAHEEGVRALEHLRQGVTTAIEELGRGFLAHPANHALRDRLRSGELSADDYYQQLLRLVYRLIVLFVAEDRDVLLRPDADKEARRRYVNYYSTARLRRLARARLGTRHSDLYRALRLVMERLGSEQGCPELGLPALNGFLFSREALPDLADCELTNYALLVAVRALATVQDEQKVLRVVNYRDLGSEELGSVYESLLEMHPSINVEQTNFTLEVVAGSKRKTTGTYYTPTSLIECLLDSALEPVLERACAQPDPEQAILSLKVCDPACGSGHFLIAAAHRIARRLAAVRTGSEEPGLEARRRALRDVVGRCLYGVDVNPMAVELCKVNLWLEALEPGKPFSFLDAHIQCGNSLIGATPALLREGIPDSAFEKVEGDDSALCGEYKKLNRAQRAGQLSLFTLDAQLWQDQGRIVESLTHMEAIGDDDVEQLHRKQERYRQLLRSQEYQRARWLADAWCAAFVWRKRRTAELPYPITEEVRRKFEEAPEQVPGWMKAEIARLRELYGFFHWHLAFPGVFRLPEPGEEPENPETGWSGGFDVVLSNPPWERIKLQEKEWFASRRPDIANAPNAAQRRKMIAALQDEDPALYAAFEEELQRAAYESHFVRNSGRFPLCGRGDINTYSIFTETMRLLLAPRGRLGCIVPSGIATDDTTKAFFQDIMSARSLLSLHDFENAAGIFPGVHRSYKFCLLTLTGSAEPVSQGATFAFFLRKVEELQEPERCFTLSAEDVALINPNTRTCPVFRSRRDLQLTKAIYERVPVLVREGSAEGNPWGVKFTTMFHMANDSHLFRTREQLEREGWRLEGNIFRKGEETYLPLYEGKMITHFDHRFASYAGEQAARQDKPLELSEEQHHDPFALPLPRYWVHQTDFASKVKTSRTALLAFRDVARSTDMRTAIFSMIPFVPCGHKLPIFIEPVDIQSLVYLATCCSSMLFDYVTRQKLGGTSLGFFILKQLPVLPPARYQQPCPWESDRTLGDWIRPRALELTYTAWDLAAFARDCGYDGPPFRWDEERRFLLRCELDAAYFHLYGIARDDVDYIMETFPIVRSEDLKRYDDYRTKRVILEIYDELQRASATGQPYRTRLTPPPADPAVAHPPRPHQS
ncbi:Eco57I restriction-modification methylase domain-containing protein [Thermogemmatispora onikobensis]|uniref:Eco57I restriction-modification methylase domain-containing protein n=1 Tax=Thermogemmatispora onikobensis TaxID=732234 RepID=UPI0008535D7A|nr:N-6 DNA methylase [Thermogemmatispora onikobensis]